MTTKNKEPHSLFYRLECKWGTMSWYVANPFHARMTKQQWKTIEKSVRGWSHSWRLIEIKELLLESHNK